MVLGMKTTLEIPDPLFRDAKKRAADEGVALRVLVERALREHLAGSGRRPGPKGLRWHVIRGTAPPAVDVGTRERLYDFLDRR